MEKECLCLVKRRCGSSNNLQISPCIILLVEYCAHREKKEIAIDGIVLFNISLPLYL